MTTTEIIEPQQFAFHDRVSKTPPQFLSFERLVNGEELNREEKNNLFHQIHSNSGGNRGYYRLGGWSFNFRQFMKRYLVKYDYDNHWTEIWAFDKTCIRTSFYTKSNIIEIVQI